MRGHAEIRKLLAVYHSLDAAERRAVDAHVRVCRQCAARQAAYAEMDHHLAGLEDPKPPASLPRSLDVILRRGQPRVGKSPRIVGRPLVPRNVLVPIGLAILLIGGMWCVIRLSTPPDVRLAETPSVTPTATPMALASPPLRGGLSASGLLGWYATQRPGSEVRNTAINGLLSAPLAAIQITPVVLRQPTPLGVAPGIAHP